MKPLLAILCASLLNAATVTVCSSGCTTTNLQTALDSLAACGDTIQIKSTQTQTGNFTITYRACAANPITVTSDRAATWLPNTFARVTPSQLGNMAVLSSNNGNPPLIGVLDGSSRPPAGWNFVGVAFTNTNVVGGGSFYMVGFNPLGDAANSSQIADKITFDRCYFYTPSLYTGINVRDLIRGDVTNLTVKNSFFGDGLILGGGTGAETHGIRMLTTAGPITITNNFIINSSSPVFTGGATPSYATYLASGLTGQYNYSWRPWKWNGDPAQPFAADYVTAAQNVHRTGPWTITNVGSTGIITTTGSPPFIAASLLDITGVGGCTIANANNWRNTQLTANTFQLLNFPGCNSAYTSGGAVDEFALTVCTKNQGEFKWGTGMTWQYNVGENSWWANQCGGQFSGFTDTLRSQTDQLGSVASFVDATHLTWTGPYRIGDPATGADSTTVDDLVACSSIPTTGMECHPITSFSGASLVVSPAFSAAPVGTYALWINYTGGAKLENVTLTHNAWKNVDQPVSVLGLSYATFIGDAGYGKTHNISQNLAFSTTSYVAGQRAFNITSAEEDNSTGPSGYTFNHNTFYYPSGLGPFFYLNGLNCGGLCSTSIQTKFDSSAVTNNLWGVSSSGGNGPFSGDAVANIHDVASMYFTNTLIENNAAPGATIGTGGVGSGNTVSGNLNATWVDPFGGLASSGIFNVQPSSAYYHAGTDGASLGADFTQLPLVNNLTVVPSSTSAILSFDVSANIADIKNTQVCVLEVSPSRNLQSDLGTYSVIASLDPTITIGADLSTQSSVILSGSHATWPITGLSSVGTYYGRLMCYGDTEWFTFTTGTSPGACSISPATLGPWTNTQVISQTMITTCSGGTITWTSSGLPAGLSGCNGVTGSSCLLSGTLSAAAIYSPTITATASNMASISPPVTVNAVPSISTVMLPNAISGMAYSQALSISGGTSPFTCSVSSGTLAGSGLTLGPACAVTGTPTSTVATYSFTARVTDTNGISATRPLTVSVTGSPCDLNGDGIVNVQDTQLAVNMSLSIIPCTANINGANVCNTVTIQRVVTASLGGACTVGP